MRVKGEFDYRGAKSILKEKAPGILKEIYKILNNPKNKLDLSHRETVRLLSKQIQDFFVKKGWKKEQRCIIPKLKYDLKKNDIPVEIEIGHERLVYADFFKFLADFSKSKISCGVMIVTHDPKKFGHTWHCSLESTKRKIKGIEETYFVPILVIGIDP